jgi:phenylalanine-4-hydroxylase
MAVGKEIISAFAGPADSTSFENTSKISETKTHKLVYSDKEKILYNLYSEVRMFREQKSGDESTFKILFEQLQKDYPKDWLLALELYELSNQRGYPIEKPLKEYLEKLAEQKGYNTLITNGLNMCKV